MDLFRRVAVNNKSAILLLPPLLLVLANSNDVDAKSLVSVASPGNFIIREVNARHYPQSSSSLNSRKVLKVRSDVPLTVQRYERPLETIGDVDGPIDDGDLRILVTSNCDTDADGATAALPVVEVVEGTRGAEGTTFVTVEVGVVVPAAADGDRDGASSRTTMPFLESSSYNATWYESGCGFFEEAPMIPPADTGNDEVPSYESVACTTESACDGARRTIRISSFRAGDYPSKGCFSKNGRAYWGRGGSVEDEFGGSDLPGAQERIWCKREVEANGGACVTSSQCDAKRLEMGISTFQSGDFPSKGCFSKNGKAYWGRGGSAEDEFASDLPGVQERIWCDDERSTQGDPASSGKKFACLSERDCNERRRELGIASFSSSADYPSKGCFAKNDMAYFSPGSMAEMSRADLPGVRERIWCTGAGRSSSSAIPALQKAEGAAIPHQERAASSSASSLRSCVFGSFLQSVISTKTDRVPPPRLRALDACDYNVEVLVYGCDHDSDDSSALIAVAAPKARVINSDMTNMVSEGLPPEECDELPDGTKLYSRDYEKSATLAFPDGKAVFVDGSNEGFTMLPPLDNDDGTCDLVVPGRPFVDSMGKSLLAPSFSSYECGAWSGEQPSSTTHRPAIMADANNNSTSRNNDELGEEWRRNALGEHASVASFAAFSIALMSNQAPSHLVEDSLKAASDEVRHARVSFDIASALLGRDIGPGPLPPSSHEFRRDLTELALAVAREGCVDETLSALAAAAEVDLIDEVLKGRGASEGTKYSGVGGELLSWIRDELRNIALDEANHSALAWRTLQWACGIDDDACNAANRSVLNEESSSAAFRLRFGRSLEGNPELLQRMSAAWESIRANRKALRSDAESNHVGGGPACDVEDNVEEGRKNDPRKSSLLSLLVENISRGM